jgi:nitrite reductase (NADH) small subunit
MGIITREEKINKSAEDSGQFFQHMKDYIGFTEEDANAIKESGRLVQKHIPEILSSFYAQLLRYPPTRKFFLKNDGTVDQEYIQKRMEHQADFWRRTASGVYDDDYARYIDYVGRAHTSQGADPNIYIPGRYVIGQVGFIQHAITSVLIEELNDYDINLKNSSIRAWNMLMMIILEVLSRAYEPKEEIHPLETMDPLDYSSIEQMAVEAYNESQGISRVNRTRDILAARLKDIPVGKRKIVEIEGLSIGIFNHKGEWVAVRNHCLHQGGPVAAGCLEGDVLTCPTHGFQYSLKNGALLVDPSVRLEMYPVKVIGGEIYISVPVPDQEQETPDRF